MSQQDRVRIGWRGEGFMPWHAERSEADRRGMSQQDRVRIGWRGEGFMPWHAERSEAGEVA
jgi:uncharacterized protein YukE